MQGLRRLSWGAALEEGGCRGLPADQSQQPCAVACCAVLASRAGPSAVWYRTLAGAEQRGGPQIRRLCSRLLLGLSGPERPTLL